MELILRLYQAMSSKIKTFQWFHSLGVQGIKKGRKNKGSSRLQSKCRYRSQACFVPRGAREPTGRFDTKRCCTRGLRAGSSAGQPLGESQSTTRDPALRCCRACSACRVPPPCLEQHPQQRAAPAACGSQRHPQAQATSGSRGCSGAFWSWHCSNQEST